MSPPPLTRVTAGPYACLAVAAVLAVPAIRGFNGFATIGPALLGAAVTAALCVALARRLRGVAYGSHRYSAPVHSPGAHTAHSGAVEREDVRRHEGGHWVVGRALGGRGGRAIARRNGSGQVRMNFRRRLEIVQIIAYYRAGEVAEGSPAGSGSDRSCVRQVLRKTTPRREHSRLTRDGERLAARLLAANARELDRVTEALRTGSHR